MKTWLTLSTLVNSPGRGHVSPTHRDIRPPPRSPPGFCPSTRSPHLLPGQHPHSPSSLSSPTRTPASSFSGGLPKKPLVSVPLGAAVARLSTARWRTHLGQAGWRDVRGVAPSLGGMGVPLGGVWPGLLPAHDDRGRKLAGSPLSPAGASKSSCPMEFPATPQIRGMRDRKRDRWGVEARPVAHERDPWGVDPRPGWGSSWVCSVTTTRPSADPMRVGGDTGGQ